jgi:hypothetical protein
MNIYMQLGMGYCLRRKMARWGINLNDQSVNQTRAYQSSINGKLATLDLKSASNSVTQALVWRMIGETPHSMLDPTWYKMLDALRTESAMIDDTPHTYELFSAMGNGFTFELESLIFFALSVSACEVLGIPEDVTVYGDDLIVPVEAVDLLTKVLAWCGFRLNTDKSFSMSTGNIFRESCGKHYRNGVDVTPLYVDGALDRAENVILLANNLLRWATNEGGWRDGRVYPVYLWILSHLSSEALATAIPFGEGDDGLIKSFDEAVPRRAYLKSEGLYARTFIGFRTKSFSYGHRERLLEGEDALVTWHYNCSFTRFTPERELSYQVQDPQPVKTPTSRKKCWRKRSRVTPFWPSLGPWVSDDGLFHPGGDLELAVRLWSALSDSVATPGPSKPGENV